MEILGYSDRKLREVALSRLAIDRFPDGEPCAQVRVYVGLASLHDPEISGPNIQLNLALPIDLSTSVRDIEDAALRAAHALLVRISQETLESFQACLQKTSEAAIVTS